MIEFKTKFLYYIDKEDNNVSIEKYIRQNYDLDTLKFCYIWRCQQINYCGKYHIEYSRIGVEDFKKFNSKILNNSWDKIYEK